MTMMFAKPKCNMQLYTEVFDDTSRASHTQ